MITVLGSINMDLVTVTKKDPSLGETVMGERFSTVPGGKGANQAIAAAKLGADVQMIGRVGTDLFGEEYIQHFHKQGISTANVEPVTDEKTGIAAITVYEGDNKIIVVPGANHHLTPDVVMAHKDDILQSDWLLLQLEIPLESVGKALEIAHEGGVRVILNPAPFTGIPKEWIGMTTYITPNEYEASELMKLYEGDEETSALLREKLVMTKGPEGVVIFEGDQEVNIPTLKVEAVDTTGAGDTFNGALAVGLTEGKTLKEACEFAAKAAALSVTKFGAQAGMPERKELEG
ncbi:ribokinase [Rossellomorea aquimaris]|nr:ribokinase [Rossellomorea aquimaris]